MASAAMDWLVDGDPSVAWQAQRDLLHRTARTWGKTRSRIATEGWGAELLSHQDPEGTWAGGLYTPKWTSTTYTLLLLWRMGLDPGHEGAQRGVEVLVDSARWVRGGVTFAKTVPAPETCISGMVVALAAYFGLIDERVDRLVLWLLGDQLEDGGWNCDSNRWDSKHGSFHTTITVLEALSEYRSDRGCVQIDQALRRGREFFLDHHLFQSHRTGEIPDARFTRFSFPPRWHFDVLRGLDYFASVGADRDDRLKDAMAVLDEREDDNGRWKLQNRWAGQEWFRMERGGQSSRWNTLRALRVRQWWEA